LALLRAGFSRPPAHTEAGGLLPHHFTLTLAGGMFLCHFPSGRPAWVLPSALPGGARTFLAPPEGGERSPGLLGLSQVYQGACVTIRQGFSLRGAISQEGALGRRAVERQVGELVRALVLSPRDVRHFEAIEAVAQFDDPVEERLQPGIPHSVAILELPDN